MNASDFGSAASNFYGSEVVIKPSPASLDMPETVRSNAPVSIAHAVVLMIGLLVVVRVIYEMADKA